MRKLGARVIYLLDLSILSSIWSEDINKWPSCFDFGGGGNSIKNAHRKIHYLAQVNIFDLGSILMKDKISSCMGNCFKSYPSVSVCFFGLWADFGSSPHPCSVFNQSSLICFLDSTMRFCSVLGELQWAYLGNPKLHGHVYHLSHEYYSECFIYAQFMQFRNLWTDTRCISEGPTLKRLSYQA